MYKNEFADLIIAIGNFLKSLSDEDYNKFLKGNFQLSEVTQKKVRKKESIKQLTQTDIDLIIDKFKSANSREEVQNILSNEAALSLKENLTKVARSLKILVQKIDKKEDIENKIIEFTIGSRLRNDAIRGLNLGNKKDNSNKGSN